MRLPALSCAAPLNPCPLGQPSASLAPNMAIIPPRNAASERRTSEGPNRVCQRQGMAVRRNDFEVMLASNAPRKTPVRKVPCQSSFGGMAEK